MNKFKKNMSMRSISDYMTNKEYPTKAETKAKHMECYDYFMSCKNSEMLKAYKEIHGLSGLEMRDMHHYYKHGRHEYDYDGDAKDSAGKVYRLHAVRVGLLVGADGDVSAVAKFDPSQRVRRGSQLRSVHLPAV